MSANEIKQRRIEGARAFIRWIDERKWTIAKWDDEADEFVPVGLTLPEYLTEWAKDMFIITEDEVLA